MRRLWSPDTRTTVRRSLEGGMPKRSRVPCTTSIGTVTASSSVRRLGATAAPLRRGGCSGNARQRTPTAPHGVRRAAGDTGSRGPPADDERRAAQLAREQVLDHRRPRSVELVRGRGCAPARDPIGLLDQRDAQPDGLRGSRRCDEVLRLHSAACAVAEDERCPRAACTLDVRSRQAERRLDLDRLHHPMLPRRLSPGASAR